MMHLKYMMTVRVIKSKYIPDFTYELINTAELNSDLFKGNVIVHVALMVMYNYLKTNNINNGEVIFSAFLIRIFRNASVMMNL
jgi:hypothetical protein